MSEIILIANGDLRLSANRVCWDTQKQTEEAVMNAIRREGHSVRRGHPFDPEKGHGFIDSQRYGIEVFRNIPADAPLVVVEAVWQYSHHVLGGLITHGPILTVANWSGQWPGLVGMLNLNGSLTKAGVQVQHPVERGFHGRVLPRMACAQLAQRRARHARPRHVRALQDCKLPATPKQLGARAGAPNSGAKKPSWASSTKAAWACTTPSSPTNSCTRPASSRSG